MKQISIYFLLLGKNHDCSCPIHCHAYDISMTSAKLKEDSNSLKKLYKDGMPLKELEEQLEFISEHEDHPDSDLPQRLYDEILQSSSILHFELGDKEVIEYEAPKFAGIIFYIHLVTKPERFFI